MMQSADGNPFKTPISDGNGQQLVPYFPPVFLEAAVQMLRQGSTRGMVRGYLRKQGLDPQQCSAVVFEAVRIVNLRIRVQGLLTMVAGAVFGIICGALMFTQETVANYYLIGLVSGEVVFAAGLFKLFSGMGRD